MIKYFRESFRRKRARRITMEYPSHVETFKLEKDGPIEFENWDNPLVQQIMITQSDVDFYRKFIQKGDMVIDIGANIGDTTVPMSLAAGGEGLTLGFEPNPFVYKVLVQNAALNQDKTNIVPVQRAISTQADKFYYISSEASFANGAISFDIDRKFGKYVFPEKVFGIPLIDFLNENYTDRLEKFSFIKTDVEGYDKEILKSISNLIAKYKPYIIAESFGGNSDAEKMELFDVISRHNYDIFYIEDFKVDAKAIAIMTAKEMLPWKQKIINIFCSPRDASRQSVY
jgi:FkbM family methyltransferase